MTPEKPISPKRKFVATALGIITLLCAVLLYLSFGAGACQGTRGADDGPGLFLIMLYLTFPPAFVCTIVAMILVGPRRCKLAWISLCAYPLLILFLLILAAFSSHA